MVRPAAQNLPILSILSYLSIDDSRALAERVLKTFSSPTLAARRRASSSTSLLGCCCRRLLCSSRTDGCRRRLPSPWTFRGGIFGRRSLPAHRSLPRSAASAGPVAGPYDAASGQRWRVSWEARARCRRRTGPAHWASTLPWPSPSTRASNLRKARCYVKTKAGRGNQLEHVCQLAEAGQGGPRLAKVVRGWRPP